MKNINFLIDLYPVYASDSVSESWLTQHVVVKVVRSAEAKNKAVFCKTEIEDVKQIKNELLYKKVARH